MGFAGTKAEAEEIKTELATFLRDELKLTLSTEKTVITHARTHKARFLGYDIWTRQDDTKRTGGRRSINGGIALGVPPQAVNVRCRNYQRGQEKPLIRNDLIRTSDYNIVAMFGTEYRGYVQYYQMAGNINWLQRSAAASGAAPSPTTVRSSHRGSRLRANQASAGPRRPDQRVRTRSLKPQISPGGRVLEPDRPVTPSASRRWDRCWWRR